MRYIFLAMISIGISSFIPIEKPYLKPDGIKIVSKAAIKPIKSSLQTIQLIDQLPVENKPQTIKLSSPSELHIDWMRTVGIDEKDFGYVDYIISHESSWLLDKTNSIGCMGLGQDCNNILPKECPNWRTDAICQLKFWDRYAHSHCDQQYGCYNGWYGAYKKWLKSGWW